MLAMVCMFCFCAATLQHDPDLSRVSSLIVFATLTAVCLASDCGVWMNNRLSNSRYDGKRHLIWSLARCIPTALAAAGIAWGPAIAMLVSAAGLMTRVTSLSKIVHSVAKAVPATAHVLVLMLFVFLLFAGFGVVAFNDVGAVGGQYFGTYSKSILTVLQVLDPGSNWAEDIARPLVAHKHGSWGAYFFFFLISIFSSWLLLPLFQAILLEKMAPSAGGGEHEGGDACVHDEGDEAHNNDEVNVVLTLKKENIELKTRLAEIEKRALVDVAASPSMTPDAAIAAGAEQAPADGANCATAPAEDKYAALANHPYCVLGVRLLKVLVVCFCCATLQQDPDLSRLYSYIVFAIFCALSVIMGGMRWFVSGGGKRAKKVSQWWLALFIATALAAAGVEYGVPISLFFAGGGLLYSFRGQRGFINSYLKALPSMLNSLIVIGAVFLCLASIGVAAFKDAGPIGDYYFGTFGKSTLTVFQVLDPGANWAEDIARPLVAHKKGSWGAYFFFFSISIFANWILVPVFIAIVMEKMAAEEEEAEVEEEVAAVADEEKDDQVQDEEVFDDIELSAVEYDIQIAALKEENTKLKATLARVRSIFELDETLRL